MRISRSASSSSRRRGSNTADTGLVVRSDLPFNVPQRSELTASAKKVWAHYFLPFPVALQGDHTKDVDTTAGADGKSVDTADYYDYRWLPPGSIEGGTDNRVFGGLMRDTHLLRRAKRTAITSPTKPSLTLSWQIQDKMHEIREALAAGLDGFTLDLLQVPQSSTDYPLQWRRAIELFEAVEEVIRQDKVEFRIVVMPDGTTSATKNSATLADALQYLVKTYPNAVYFQDNKFMLAPFQPEGGAGGINLSGMTPLQFWTDVLNRLRNSYSVPTIFWPCYQKQWTDWHPSLTNLSYGASLWGDRDPTSASAENNRARRAYYTLKTSFSTTQKWMHPVAVGDQRPRESRWWEQDHAETLRRSWEAAIGDDQKDANGELLHRTADQVQIPTWSDFPEGAHICPSRNHGHCLVALNWYWLIRYKTGSFPKIERDVLYLSHRLQPTDGEPNTTVTYTGGTQTEFMAAPTGNTSAKDTVGVSCFLTAPAQVVINVGGTLYDKGTINAGYTVLRAPLVPIGTGLISVKATRNGTTIASISSSENRKVTTSRPSQDYSLRFVSSLK